MKVIIFESKTEFCFVPTDVTSVLPGRRDDWQFFKWGNIDVNDKSRIGLNSAEAIRSIKSKGYYVTPKGK